MNKEMSLHSFSLFFIVILTFLIIHSLPKTADKDLRRLDLMYDSCLEKLFNTMNAQMRLISQSRGWYDSLELAVIDFSGALSLVLKGMIETLQALGKVESRRKVAWHEWNAVRNQILTIENGKLALHDWLLVKTKVFAHGLNESFKTQPRSLRNTSIVSASPEQMTSVTAMKPSIPQPRGWEEEILGVHERLVIVHILVFENDGKSYELLRVVMASAFEVTMAEFFQEITSAITRPEITRQTFVKLCRLMFRRSTIRRLETDGATTLGALGIRNGDLLLALNSICQTKRFFKLGNKVATNPDVQHAIRESLQLVSTSSC